FDRDFGVGRDRQTGDGAANHLDRGTAHAADPVELTHAIRDLGAPGEELERIAAEDHRHRAGLAAVKVFLAMQTTVLAWRDVVAQSPGVMEHDSVGADVDPAVVRIAGDVEGAGPDISTAVARVPARRGEDGHVDLVASADVLEDGPVLDVL